MSQFPPSESSKIKHTGTEKVIYKYLRFDSGNAAVLDVAIHDEVSGSGQAFCVIKMRKPTAGDVWRALNASAGYVGSYAKICIAVDEDIDIWDPAMINWAICFNVRPEKDVAVVQGKSPGLDPSAYPPGVPTHVSRMASSSCALDRRNAAMGVSSGIAAAKRIHGAGERNLGGTRDSRNSNRACPGSVIV